MTCWNALLLILYHQIAENQKGNRPLLADLYHARTVLCISDGSPGPQPAILLHARLNSDAASKGSGLCALVPILSLSRIAPSTSIDPAPQTQQAHQTATIRMPPFATSHAHVERLSQAQVEPHSLESIWLATNSTSGDAHPSSTDTY
jgi:hypothetical protein